MTEPAPKPAQARENSYHDAIVRLLAIAMRRYTADIDRESCSRNLLLNAVRLARIHNGIADTERLLDQAMAEPDWRRGGE